MILALLLAALPIAVDTDIPGGNVIVQCVDERKGVVHVAPDCRKTGGEWFWWSFRVRNAERRNLKFVFPRPSHSGKMCVGSLGPSVSVDGGRSWNWLNAEGREDTDSFSYSFSRGMNDVRFAFAPPYTRRDWPFETERLAVSREGRDVPVTRFGNGSRWRLFLTARHHACESTASYVLEGLVAALREDPWVNENARVDAIPFMDIDGVENGEQGKGRLPHDHNRDYVQFIYPETRALKELVSAADARSNLVLIDLHDPLAGTAPGVPARHDNVFSFGPREPERINRWNRYRQLLREETKSGKLVYDGSHDVPFGTGTNVDSNYSNGGNTESAARWFRKQRGAWMAISQEIGYARAGGTVTAQSARELGVAMARSIVRLLSEERPTVVLGGTVDAVRAAINARKRGEETLLFAPRPYLGEDRAGVYDLDLKHFDSPDDPLVSEMFNPSYGAEDSYRILRGRGWKAKDILVPFSNRTAVSAVKLSARTTPHLVKRALDRALLSAGVEYLTGAVAINVDTNGVTIATRAGERRIEASRVVDARMKMPDVAGEYDVSWAIVTNRAAPCVEHVRRRVRLPDGSPSSRARAEREIRDSAFGADIIDMAPMGRFSPVGGSRDGKMPSPFIASADVVVVGGGTAGAPAAVAAARSGAKTVVVEWLNVLGGIATEGRIGGYYHGNRRGFTSEIDKAMKGVARDYCLAKGEWYRRELGRLGAEVWFGALAYGVRMEGNRVAAVKVALADGTCAEIRCKVVVDASGNCDIAAAAGCDTEYLSAKELSLQGAGVAPQPLGLTGVNSDVGFVDETCPQDIFGFLLRTRLSVPDRTWNVSQMSDSRERRRLVGEMRITPLDILAGRRYHDTICVTKSNFDTHGQTDSDIFFVKSPGKRGDVHHAHVPYRCLLPKRVDGLLVAGLGVSAHRDAMPVLRMQPDVQNVGYAAGLAAAQAAMRGVPPRGIDVADLQRKLMEKGCIDAADIADSDSPPPDEAVFKVEECRKLHEKLKDASWDEGWNFKGMSQFGRSVSDVDSALIALGTCRYGFAAPEVKRLADMLAATNAYSHFRAIARAAEGCGVVARDRRRLAKSLHRLLSLPGVGGHSRERVEPLTGYDDSVADRERTLVLRELVLARALYNLGDEAGLARRTLRAYMHDYRRAYANHAKMVLAPEEKAQGFRGVSDFRDQYPVRGGFSSPPVGWMTWYAVRFGAGEDVVLRNARDFIATFGDCLSEKPVLWVDWEWDHAGFKCGSQEGEDVLTPRRSVYPRGLAPLAKDLKDMGFLPALWVSVVSDVRTNALFASRPEWMLPYGMRWCGPVWGDPTAKGFCEEYVPELFRTYRSWGYEAFKWDTLPHAMLVFDEERASLARPDMGDAQAIMRRMIDAGRKAVGPDTFLLSCSGETDDAVETASDLFDAARVGADVWKWDDFVREGVDRLLKYSGLHGRKLWCDMDNLVLREPFSNLAQARTRVSLTSLFGVPVTLGDEIAALDPDRVDMLRKALPTLNVLPAGEGRRDPDSLFTATVDFRRKWGDWQVKAFSNFDTNRMRLAVLDVKDCAVWDFWRGELVCADGGRVVLEVPPGDTRLLRITPLNRNGYTLIGTTRHISQGGVELESFSVSDSGSVSAKPTSCVREGFDLVLLSPKGDIVFHRVQPVVPNGSSGSIRRMLEDPGAFAVGKLPPRSPSWPSRRLEIGKDEWLFDIDDWRVDLSKGWRWLWRPKADFPAMLEGFERPSFDDSGWESIDLPASWEGLGKGTPIYVNAGWTFPKDSPPHVPLSSAPASTQPGWTVVSEPNPTARLRRSFDLPDDWCGREIRLWIGAAQAALAVWCNGTFVGFSQGATDAAEFDLTPHVRSKGNVLALQVFKYAAGTYLEDHDAWRVSGIYRETFLYSVPKSHIADVTLSSDIDAKRISATVAIANPPEGGTVEFSAGGVSESKSAARRVDAVLRSGSFPEWNPESPSLVPVRVLLRDGAGKILDIRHFRTALCRSEIENGVYRINGRPFKFQGVNRHEIDSLRFRAVTRDMMLRDAKMMKEANFNAVRCSHYTHHPLWYEICDRFGLAVVAEANIESHGLSYHKCVLPGDCPEWVSPVHDRLERMVRNTGNHPSVVMWSLGNEAGWGGAFESGASLVRGIDPMKRPIQYADMNAVADFDSQTYPTEKWLREWIAGTAVRKGERGEKTALRQHGPQPSGRPYVANEYAHAMGNSTGNFAEYWEVFDSEPRMAGGFVWEWVEHGISSRDALGRVRVAKFSDPRTWLYGGDFGDMPNGGNFCCDGLVRADRTANPGLAEVSYVQQPLSLNMVDGEIELTNRRYFTYLTPLRNRIGWMLLVDGRQMLAGELELPGKIAPRAKWMQRFEDVRRLCENVKGEKVLRVSLLENGAVIAECEALIASGMPESLPKAGGHPVFKVEWQAVFDRVPPDNDRGCRFVCTTNIAAAIESAADGTVRTLRFDVRGEHSRRGIRCLLPASAVKRVAWYGRGPWENTPDRCHGALLGIWNVEDPVTLATPYSRPQENGQRCDVRWLELESENGSVVRIGGEKPFVFCLRPYTSRELASAAHFTDLPPFSGQPECWELTLDSAHRGVGGDNSWNAQPMEKYRLKPASGSFKWVFQDCGVSASAGKLRAETAAISGVSVLPSATHTHPQK